MNEIFRKTLYTLLLTIICFGAHIGESQSRSDRPTQPLGGKVMIPLNGTEWVGEGKVKIKLRDSLTKVGVKETTYPLVKMEFGANGFEVEDLIAEGEIKGFYSFDEKGKFVPEIDFDELEDFVEDLLDTGSLGPISYEKVKIKVKFKIYEDGRKPSYCSVSVSFRFEVDMLDFSTLQGDFKAKGKLYLQP